MKSNCQIEYIVNSISTYCPMCGESIYIEGNENCKKHIQKNCVGYKKIICNNCNAKFSLSSNIYIDKYSNTLISVLKEREK